MLNAIRNSPAFRNFLVWAGALLLIVLLVWVWSKRQVAPSAASAATPTSSDTSYQSYQDNGGQGPVPPTIVINGNPQQTTNGGAPNGTGSSTTSSSSGSTTNHGGPQPPVHTPGPTPAKRVVGSAARQPQYVTVVSWRPGVTPWNSTLWGIAAHYGTSVSHLLSLPGNARFRANPNLLHPGDRVQVA